MSVLLKGEGLCFSYQQGGAPCGNFLLDHVDFSLNKGEIVGFMGPSGCGKTTLCYILAGIIPKMYTGDLKGRVSVSGEPIEEIPLAGMAEKIGFIFQDPDTQLFSNVIEEDLAFGPENLCLDWEDIHGRIAHGLRLTHMEKWRLSSPKALSGGQRQLGAIASVLTLNPPVLIFDEAMAQLDEAGKIRLKQTLLSLKGEGKGIVLVEHDIENLDIADRIITFKNGKLCATEGTGLSVSEEMEL
ncbi:MAG: ABC transporter ATP-binding protein [Anaerovorax sp.]